MVRPVRRDEVDRFNTELDAHPPVGASPRRRDDALRCHVGGSVGRGVGFRVRSAGVRPQGPLGRLVQTAAVRPSTLRREQPAVLCPAAGTATQSGVCGARPGATTRLGGLSGQLRLPDPGGRDVHRSGSPSGQLLRGCRVHRVGPDPGLSAQRGRLRASRQPEAGLGASAAPQRAGHAVRPVRPPDPFSTPRGQQ